MKDKQICEYYPSMDIYGFKVVLKREMDANADTIQTTIDYIMAKDLLKRLFVGINPPSKEAEKQIELLERARDSFNSISKEDIDTLMEQIKKITKGER